MERTQNKYVADRLNEAAALLEQQGANRFRVNAYRKAAGTVESLEHDVSIIVAGDGLRGLTALPGIGPMIGRALVEMIPTGHWTQLEYREEAEAGKLPKIAPGRFNPNNEAWLPVLHTERGPWQFTVFYSNTALAHQLNRNRDWVVINFHTDSTLAANSPLLAEEVWLRIKKISRSFP